jgi:hypothetical protein
MRLPQLTTRHLPFRFIAFTLFALSTAMPSLSAGAAAQSLVCSPASLKFGAVTLGQVETQIVFLTNNGQAGATISAINVSPTEFSVSGLNPQTVLAPGQVLAFNVAFSPTVRGWTGGRITINSSSGSVILQVAGQGATTAPLAATPASLSFGQVAMGSSATLPLVLTNARFWKETIKSWQTVGSGFSVSGPALPVTLSAGQSVTLNVTFTPQAVGLTGGSIFIPNPSLDIPMSGTGTTGTGTTGTGAAGQLNISPASVSFGDVEIGTTSTQPLTMSAAGGSVTISSAASSSSQFGIAGLTLPLTLNAGQSAQLNVSFTPQAAAAATGTLSFTSTATNPKAQELVTGTGTAPYVTLSWSAGASPVSGYNIYRGTAPGAYSKMNATLNTATTYNDSTVTSGTTYYYAATAVNSAGQESGYSTPVQVSIP